jgi:hypothetical protein
MKKGHVIVLVLMLAALVALFGVSVRTPVLLSPSPEEPGLVDLSGGVSVLLVGILIVGVAGVLGMISVEELWPFSVGVKSPYGYKG